MPKTANKISLLIEDQLPAFISDEYELFGKFVQKYYEQLELQGQPLDIANNIATYRNIDFYEKKSLQPTHFLIAFGSAVAAACLHDLARRAGQLSQRRPYLNFQPPSVHLVHFVL